MEYRLLDPGSADYVAAVDLRRRVLRIPLGLDFTAEQLDAERDDLHLAAVEDDRVVACLVLTPIGGADIKMRQVAVEPDWQRRGVGRTLVEFSEAEARRRGFSLMTMSARDTAVSFYECLGYLAVGGPFTEVGIPHQRMDKEL